MNYLLNEWVDVTYNSVRQSSSKFMVLSWTRFRSRMQLRLPSPPLPTLHCKDPLYHLLLRAPNSITICGHGHNLAEIMGSDTSPRDHPCVLLMSGLQGQGYPSPLHCTSVHHRPHMLDMQPQGCNSVCPVGLQSCINPTLPSYAPVSSFWNKNAMFTLCC